MYSLITKPKPGAMIDRSHPLSKGLVAFWLMNEGSGSVIHDISKKDNLGTLHNIDLSSYLSGWCGSNSGGGICLDGVNDDIICGSDSSIAISSMSSHTMLFQMNATGANNSRIYRKGQHYIRLTNVDVNGASLLSKVDYGSGTDALATTTNRISYKQNHSIAIVFNEDGDNRIKTYVDGNLMSLSTDNAGVGTITSDSGDEIHIGSSIVTYFLAATFNEFRIYNRPLSFHEIKQWSENPFCSFVTTPLYYVAPIGGWTGIINGITNPAYINGIAVANIAKVNGVA